MTWMLSNADNLTTLMTRTISLLPLDVLHDAHTASVASPRDHAHVPDLELDGLDGLSGLEIDLDGVVNLKEPTRVKSR